MADLCCNIIANATLGAHGEALVKFVSHMEGIRVAPHQAREIFKNGRGRQFGTYRKRLTLPTSGEVIQVFRVNRDCGNVAYKDFLEQVAVPDPNKLNEIFAHTRMTAEKAGDVSGCWIGALEIAAMARRTVDVFPSRINPADHYNGLERALKTFGRISKSTSTMNDKRKGSFDCSLQGGEATAIMERLNVIREYLEPSMFSCMHETEASTVHFEY